MRWHFDHPYLYSMVTTISQDDCIIDEVRTRFGVRTIEFKYDQGFFLNSQYSKLNGVCLHHDNGPIGAIANRRAIERKVEILKSMGVNAIRTSHNPPSIELLDVCDEQGIVVLVEAFDTWRISKTENDYSKHFDQWAERDIKDMVLRDRNHPCVIMWSIGNEILEQDEDDGWKIAKMLNDYVKELDTTRPTTAGFNHYPDCYENNLADQVDIIGLNYKPTRYVEALNNHNRIPGKPIYGSETSSCTSSRGVYHFPIEKYEVHDSLQVTSYDIIGPVWAYPADVEFHYQELHPNVLGEFIWTGFDYLGEPTPYCGCDNETHGHWNKHWPSKASYFAPIDMCGFTKDRFYMYQSQWTQAPMVHLVPHWNIDVAEGTKIPVYAYTNCDEVELFLNGKSLGKRVKGEDLSPILISFIADDYQSEGV